MVGALRHAGTGQRGVDEGTDLLGGIVEDLGIELAGDGCQSLDFKISFWFRAQPVCSNGAFGVSMMLIPVTFRHPAE